LGFRGSRFRDSGFKVQRFRDSGVQSSKTPFIVVAVAIDIPA
jgi:hypothetical protein